MNNFNDQSIPGLNGVATTPTRVLDLCVNGEYVGRDVEPIRPGQRVVHIARGAGRVDSLGTLSMRNAFVIFDSGTSMYVQCTDLFHE